MKSILTRLAAALVAVTAVCFAAATVAQADQMDDILKRGELIVAVQTQGPPVSFVDKNGDALAHQYQLERRQYHRSCASGGQPHLL